MASNGIEAVGGVSVCPGSSRLLYTIDEAAERLGLPRKTLWKLVKTERVAAVRLGARWFISTETLERLVTEGAPLERSGSALEAAALESQTEGKDQ